MSMVQVSGVTYRLVALANGIYDAVRLLDDARMGSFRGVGTWQSASASGGDHALLRRIAQAAQRLALTRWSASDAIA